MKKALGTVLALTLLAAFIWAFEHHYPTLIRWIDQLGILAPFLFLTIYCLATLLLLPTMVLTLAGGALFGPVYGTLLNLIGATTGAACAFLISRHLAQDWFARQTNPKLKKLIQGVDQRGWQFLALLRLFPIIPFNLVNYGLGITHIGFRLYTLTTFFFLLPAEIIYTYCGYAGKDALSSPELLLKNNALLMVLAIILLIAAFKIVKRT